MANKPLKSIKFPGLTDTYTIPQIDTSLTVGGKAADAQAVGNKFTEVSATAGKAFPTDTLSGDIVTFTDGADDIPMKSVVVNIEPVQDLHGYDHPWPAGGGKNLVNFPDIPSTTRNGVTYRVENGRLYIHGTCADGISISADTINLASDTYTISAQLISGSTSGSNNSINAWSSNSTRYLLPFGTSGASSNSTFTDDVARVSVYININAVFNNAVIELQIEKGNSMTSFAPYSNICPISGWTGAQVSHSGADRTNPTTYSITFPSEAGTVYGGELDVTTGVLTVDRAIVDLGTLDWSAYTLASNCFKAVLSDGKATRTNYSADGACSSYAKADYITTLRDTDKTFGIGYTHLSATVCYVAVQDSSYSDATAFKTAMSGVQLCYQLATPITYHLTPTEIKSLLGDNNVWADCGNTEVTYRADTKLYIEKKIAEVINALS